MSIQQEEAAARKRLLTLIEDIRTALRKNPGDFSLQNMAQIESGLVDAHVVCEIARRAARARWNGAGK